MSRKKVFFLSLILCFLPACGFQSQKAAEDSLVLPVASSSVTRHILENGLTLLVKEDHRTPMVSLLVYVKTGSAHEGRWTGSGISHAVEHMFFKGTPTRGVGEISKTIQSYGGDINAFTSFDVTGYSLVVNRDYLEDTLALLADALTHLLMDPEEFAKEKEVILGEIRLNRDDPERLVGRLFWESAFREHPYRHPVIGYDSLLRGLTHEDLLAYYREKYIPNNMILVMVGDLETEKALASVEKYFQQFERKSFPPEPRVMESPQRGLRRLQKTLPIQMAHLQMGYHTVNVTHPDMVPLDVLAILLGDGESSRLVKSLRKEKRLVYDIDAYHYTPVDPGILGIGALLEPDNLSKTLQAIQDEISRIQREGVKEEELEKAKRKVLASFYFDRETIEAQANDLAENEAVGLDPLFSERYVRRIKEVTREEVQRVAEGYLKDDNLTIASLVPEGFSKEENVPVSESQPERTIQKFVLSNGTRLLLHRDANQPTVSLGVALMGGLRFEESSNEGISNFFAQMIPKGTLHKSEEEIAEWIDARGAEFAPFSGQNSFGLQLKVLKEDLPEGLRILADLVAHPAFPEEELEKERERTLGEIRLSQDQIFQVGGRLLRQTLFHQHPYRFYPLGREESISQLTREDLLQFHRRVLRPDQMVVTVFGDIDLEETKKSAEELFGNLRGGEGEGANPPPEPPLEEPRQAVQYLPKEQTLLLIGFHGISIRDEDYYPFEVLTAILSGGSGRLYTEIREKLGQAYTLAAYPVWGYDPGYYVFYVATTEEALSGVEELILNEIASLQKEPVPEEAIHRAKESLINLHKLSIQTPGSFSFQAALDELYGLGYDRYRQYEANIRAVTAEDIRRVAETYLDLGRRATIFVFPESKKGNEHSSSLRRRPVL